MSWAVLTKNNEIDKEMSSRILADIPFLKFLWSTKNLLGSKSVSRELKIQLYTILLCSVTTYGVET